jgi:hypothetical protein
MRRDLVTRVANVILTDCNDLRRSPPRLSRRVRSEISCWPFDKISIACAGTGRGRGRVGRLEALT